MLAAPFGSKPFVVFAIHCEAAIFIADDVGRPAPVELIIALDEFALGGRYVGSERKQEMPGESFLKCYPGAGVSIVTA
jgi:hypothetical protein